MLHLLDISEICYMIQKLNSYNLLTNTVSKKSYEQFTDQMQIDKKTPECWKWIFQKEQNLKPSNVDLASVFEHVRKKL